MKLKIIIADDHSIVRMGLKTLVGYQKDMTVVGEAKNGDEAVQLAKELSPDVVVMDLMMPKTDGATATQQILAESPATKVIILTSYTTSDDLVRAVSYGASGALAKDSPAETILKAIRTVAAGGTSFAQELSGILQEQPLPEFTETQRQILESVVRGLSNKEIAMQFGISPVSARRQLTAIFAKLGAATRAEAVGIALKRHLLRPSG